jgi:hypothetical protein
MLHKPVGTLHGPGLRHRVAGNVAASGVKTIDRGLGG